MARTSILPREKTAEDLLVPEDEELNLIPERETAPVHTPFDQVYAALLSTEGERLEMMSRTTPSLAVALYRNNTRRCKYDSSFDNEEKNLLLRVSISTGGLGRKEMVEALQSGAGVPGEFFGSGMGGRSIDRDS